jgi:hypothetical protein
VILPTIISWVEGEIDIYTLEEEEFQESKLMIYFSIEIIYTIKDS